MVRVRLDEVAAGRRAPRAGARARAAPMCSWPAMSSSSGHAAGPRAAVRCRARGPRPRPWLFGEQRLGGCPAARPAARRRVRHRGLHRGELVRGAGRVAQPRGDRAQRLERVAGGVRRAAFEREPRVQRGELRARPRRGRARPARRASAPAAAPRCQSLSSTRAADARPREVVLRVAEGLLRRQQRLARLLVAAELEQDPRTPQPVPAPERVLALLAGLGQAFERLLGAAEREQRVGVARSGARRPCARRRRSRRAPRQRTRSRPRGARRRRARRPSRRRCTRSKATRDRSAPSASSATREPLLGVARAVRAGVGDRDVLHGADRLRAATCAPRGG